MDTFNRVGVVFTIMLLVVLLFYTGRELKQTRTELLKIYRAMEQQIVYINANK